MTLHTTLNAMLNPLAAGGAWPLVARQGTPTPYIVYQRIGSDVLNIIDGPPPLDNTHLQIDVYASVYSDALQIADNIASTLQAAVESGAIGCYALVSPRDLFEPDTRLYRVLMEFSVWTA